VSTAELVAERIDRVAGSREERLVAAVVRLEARVDALETLTTRMVTDLAGTKQAIPTRASVWMMAIGALVSVAAIVALTVEFIRLFND
jgi:hypothetical protein